MASRRNSWSRAEEAFLRELYPDTPNAELAGMMRDRFGTGRTEKAVRSRARLLKLRKAEGHVRNPPSFWTGERVEWFRSFVPGHTEGEISAEHERLWGVPLTEGQIGNAKTRFGVRSGTRGGRFGPGHVPANKGRKWDEFMSPEGQAASRRTCFARGHVPANAGELLDERRGRDGYWFVKVDPRDAAYPMRYWVSKARFEWERANGRPCPDDCLVMFADKDRENFDPGNLVLVKKRSRGVMARCCPDWHGAESLRLVEAMADLKIAVSDRRKETA